MAIHPTAIVDSKAEIAADAEIGPYCVIDAKVTIERGCRLYHNVYLTGDTHIGEACELHPGVIVGHAPQDVKYDDCKSYCKVGARSILREYVTVHRGSTPESTTEIGPDCFLLGGSHVAHDCVVGKRVTLINNALLAGHVRVDDLVTISGAAVVHQFVRIGQLAMIAGNGRVTYDIVPFAMTDVHGRIAGLNRVGLRRAGITREQQQEIREAYRILYDRKKDLSSSAKESSSSAQRIAKIAELVQSAPGQTFLNFVREESKRGLAGRSRL